MMELHFSFSSAAIFLLFFLFFLFRFLKWQSKTSKMPPGPWKLPLIGNLHQMIRLSRLPHCALAELAKKHGDLMHLQLGQKSIVVATSANMAKELLKNNDVSIADRPPVAVTNILSDFIGREVAFSPYGDYWRQMRKVIVLELLSNKRVQLLASLREDETSKLIQSIQFQSSSGSAINLTEMIILFASNMICKAAFGSECKKDQLAFVELTNELAALLGGFAFAELFPSLEFVHAVTGMKAKVLNIYKQLDKILENIVDQHRDQIIREGFENHKEDLVDLLLKLEMSGGDLDVPITTKDIKSMVSSIFAAGSDTSSVVLIWVMSELMRHPRVMNKAQAEVREQFQGKRIINQADIQELSYLKLVIKETLRLHPALPLLVPRQCREHVEINGYQIPIKTSVIINAWAIGRDPKYWDDAESFVPERFINNGIDFKGNDFQYIPFGSGRRMCPGISFGISNVELPLSQLLYHFNWKLPSGIEPEQLDMTQHVGLVACRQNDLYLVATPYTP